MAKIYAELSVTCMSENLDTLSIITGLPSSSGHRIGSKSRTGIILDYSQWNYETDVIETFYTEDVSRILIDKFSTNFFELKKFIEQKKCKVSICFILSEIGHNFPALTLDREMVKFAFQLNAEIYFDGL